MKLIQSNTVLSAALLMILCQTSFAQNSDEPINVKSVTTTHVEVLEVSNPGTPGKTFIAETIIASSIMDICAAIMDYPAYPQFMPNTDKVSVISTSEATTVIDMTLGLPLGKIKKYRLQMTSAIAPESCRVSWKLLPSPELTPSETIVDTKGYWQLSPAPDDASKTLVKYDVFADPGPIPFGFGWIVNILSEISLPRTLEALRERVAVKKAPSE